MSNGITLDELKSAKMKLIKKGFIPIIAKSDKKHPIGKWENYRLTDWKEHLKYVTGVRANVGILTGEGSNIIVVDIDNKKPKVKKTTEFSWYSENTGVEDWHNLCLENGGEPNTLKVATPSGGSHFYFTYDKELAKKIKTTNTYVMSRNGKLCAIDLRGDGGFLMTPPSRFIEGQYCWQPTDKIMDVTIAPIPEWLSRNIIQTCMKNGNKKNDEAYRKRTYTEAFENDGTRDGDFELFKKSPYYKNHTIYKIDKYRRIKLQEPLVDIECSICERTHVNHISHPLVVRKGEDLLFICRPTTGVHHSVRKINVPNNDEKPANDAKPTPHLILMEELFKVSTKEKLTKSNGWIYKPISESKPCAYKPYMQYEDFINKTLRNNNKVFQASPKRFTDIIRHLELYDDIHLSKMKINRDFIAFQNGVLNIQSLEFLEYSDKKLKDVVARNYIDQIFTSKTHTPLFDNFVMYQIPDDTEDREGIFRTLCALIGRLLFLTGEHDNLKVALLFYGESNTGKTTLANIIKSFFQSNMIGSITSNFEEKFGLDSLYEKDIVLIPDMPHNISKILDPTLMQSMIDGDYVNKPGKFAKARCEPFRIPIMAAGNVFPFDDKKGAQIRRWVMFVFDTFITNKDTKLERTIIDNELPNLINKCLVCYWNMVKKHPKADFWEICPTYFRENKEIGRMASNYLHRFLVADKNENKTLTSCYYVRKVLREPRICCPIEDVKKMFERYMKFNHESIKKCVWDDTDHATFKALGYEVKKVHMCKACNKKAVGGKEKCCEDYSQANRVKKVSVMDMELVCEPILPPNYQVEAIEQQLMSD